MTIMRHHHPTPHFPMRNLIGEKAPNMTLEAFHADSVVTSNPLTDFSGKWRVLFFYPADFTFVCPTELESLADNYAEFTARNTEILSVSTDTVFSHKAWHNTSAAIKKITFPMLADPTGKLCKEMGTYIEAEGLSLRATFIIDPDGIIKGYEIHDNSIGRSVPELLRKLDAAQFVREHGDQVCPVNWKPGSATLTPGLDLVGKI